MRKGSDFRAWVEALDAALLIGACGALAVALWLFVSYGSGSLQGISSDSMYTHADFDTFWRSAVALWNGQDIYETGVEIRNLNPPFWTLLLSPLGFFDSIAAYRFFIVIGLLVTVGSLAWMADELRLRSGWTAVGVGALLVSSPMLDTLRLGQIYPLLTLGLVAAWVADRRDKPLLSGCALGLVVALKPSLVPILLWPLMRRRWNTLGVALGSGAAATLIGLIVAGPKATLDWLRLLASVQLDGYWDNASLPAAAARLFTENKYVEPIATLPWAVPVAYVLGVGIVVLTVVKTRRDPEMGFWALVAASLLVAPMAWYRYLVLLGPGILLLLRRERVAPALLLLALQLIPQDWAVLWQNEYTPAAALALTLYFFILFAQWLAFLLSPKEESALAPKLVGGSRDEPQSG